LLAWITYTLTTLDAQFHTVRQQSPCYLLWPH